MNKPPAKWPHYAEWHRLEAVARLKTIQAVTRQAQELLRTGQALEAVILLGDVREAAAAALEELERARKGER